MRRAINEKDRRREKQVAHNLTNNITPVGVKRQISDVMEGARNSPCAGRLMKVG
jgi:excinuclease ABC subunit B